MTTRIETLSELLIADISDAKPGHCMRVDDLTLEDSVGLQQAIIRALRVENGTPVRVHIVDNAGGDGRVTIEEAIGLRNDVAVPDEQASVLVLLVPPTLAREASSLDNAFQRISYSQLLESAADRAVERIRELRPSFPANELMRLTRKRIPVEDWLDFLESVEAEPTEPFGKRLWRIGLVPDGGDDEEVRARLRDNDGFVRKVIDPAGAGHAIGDRLRQTRLAPGPQFNQVRDELTSHEDHLNEARTWTKAIAEKVGINFDQFELVETNEDSDLENLEVLSFRSANGTVSKSTGLELVDGNLVCEISDESEGKVVVKWRTTPTTTTRVHRWLLSLRHPEDLRLDDESALVESRVAGSRRSATLKLNIASEDITGGFLFVVEVLPLDDDDQPIQLPDSAITESEAFELVFHDDDEPSPAQSRASTAASLGAARLIAVSKGANSTDEDHAAWDWNRQQFSVRIGTSRSVQIPVNGTIYELQQQIIDGDAAITSFEAVSPYGLALPVEEFEPVHSELPPAFAKKRRQIMEMLRGGTDSRSVPEVFPWTDESRAAVQEYLATYKRALDGGDQTAVDTLQRLDTIDLSLGNALNPTAVTIVLPLNPIRLAWMSAYDELTHGWAEGLLDRARNAAGRRQLVDFEGLTRIAPGNIPFAVVTPRGEANVYFDELTFGLGLLLPIGHASPEVLASTVCTVFGLVRQSAAMSSDSAMIADRLVEYRKAHPYPKAIRLAAMHPGDSAVLADAIASFLKRAEGDCPRLEVVAYGEADRYAEPLSDLTRLQIARESETLETNPRGAKSESLANSDQKVEQSPLFPPIGASLRPHHRIATDPESIHVSIVSGISDLTPAPAPPQALNRFASLDDLLCPIVTTNIEGGDRGWTVSPALNPRTSHSYTSSIVAAHRSHQTATGSILGFEGPLALHVEVSGDTLDDIRVLHERSDWVLTLDHFVGLNFYESRQLGEGATSYILDYAPDFIDGLSHRLTVTTQHRAEVAAILERAMTELGLEALDASTTQVLGDLMTVSGRLILRLQSSEGFARESVSLAALIAHLRMQDKLEGAVIVPVDSHQEIFGRTAPGNETGRRCDMLIVRVSQRKFQVECVEVKSRRHAVLPTDLANDIADQLESTKALLEERYFAVDPPRIDALLHRAQLAGLLHYYADRAVTNGLIAPEKVGETHKHIDSFVEGLVVDVEITMRGYVISLGGEEGIPAKHRGIPMTVLTASDLGKLGFSVLPGKASLGEEADDHSESAQVLPPEKDSVAVDSAPPTPFHPHHGDGSTASEASSAERSDTGVASVPDHPEVIEPPSPETASAENAFDGGSGISHASEVGATAEPQGSSEVVISVGRATSGTEVTWEPSTKGSPHAFIVGIPGQGKSVTTRRLIRELAEQGLPSLVIDFHGDMAASPPANAEVLSADSGLPFTPFDILESNEPAKVNQAAWELAEVIQFVGSMGEIQRSNVYKALQEVYKTAFTDGEVPTLIRFAAALEEVEQGGRAKNARERVRPLTDFGLFDESASRSFNPRAAGMVVDLSKLKLDEVQIAATSFLLRKVYRDMFSWAQDGTLKLAIVLDEAHRVAKDVTLPKLMKEGRKYGVVVVVASQGLSDFHPEVLGNAGMKIIFRTNHPESRSVARYLRGRAGQDLSVEVEKLSVGQAYVATAEVPQARRTAMYE